MALDFIQNHPFILAFLLGLIPALVWLWFWMKEDIHPEPAKMVTLSFVGGMLAVLFVLPFEQLVYTHFQGQNTISFILWSALEETFKFGFVYFIALRNKVITDEPIDDIIYLIVSALGFATAENTLFLIPSINIGDLTSTIVSGNMRFVGASLLHIISSATIGICMALAFYKTQTKKRLYIVVGIILAIILHTLFNLFIMDGTYNIFFIFGIVWIGIIILLLMFEKIKILKH